MYKNAARELGMRTGKYEEPRRADNPSLPTLPLVTKIITTFYTKKLSNLFCQAVTVSGIALRRINFSAIFNSSAFGSILTISIVLETFQPLVTLVKMFLTLCKVLE